MPEYQTFAMKVYNAEFGLDGWLIAWRYSNWHRLYWSFSLDEHSSLSAFPHHLNFCSLWAGLL